MLTTEEQKLILIVHNTVYRPHALHVNLCQVHYK